MDYIFVDETGDPGTLEGGGTPYFGMALLHVKGDRYRDVKRLLAQIHWLCGNAAPIYLRGDNPIRALNLLRGLKEYARNEIISASGLYIDKIDYGGRYLNWADSYVVKDEWPYYLRNYIVRHLLEFHFNNPNVSGEIIDLVIDRVTLNEERIKNTHDYLNSRIRRHADIPFKIPHIEFITMADDEYVGGLEIAHLFSDVLRELIKGTASGVIKELTDFMRFNHFMGGKKAVKNG